MLPQRCISCEAVAPSASGTPSSVDSPTPCNTTVGIAVSFGTYDLVVKMPTKHVP